MTTLRSQALGSTAVVFAALLAAGCGDTQNREKVYPVSGKVFYNGAPAVGAEVILYSRAGGVATTFPVGTVGEDGTYHITTYTSGDGAPAGTYDVGIVWRRDVDARGNSISKSGGLYPDFFNEFYANRTRPQFSGEVKPESNEWPGFELKDVAPARNQGGPPKPKK
jgi:hypothetical protein